MKKLALITVIVLAGCAATRTPTGGLDPRLAGLEEKRQMIAEREKHCIDETQTPSRDEMARIAATPDYYVELRIQRENDERDREVSECRATGDMENAGISEQERKEYELQAQQEHDRAALMMTLTTTKQH
ncbi:MAG TPA: hypothetical protein VIX59_01615 [Candidatus Binataceae bacterium]